LHKVIKGGADRSYGVHVAQLAGLPAAVVHRAQDVLQGLEAGNLERRQETEIPAQIPMFAESSPALEKLKTLDPNAMSPLEALTALYELKKLL
jgi:DNA mismatch repair protein MutS